MIERRSYPRIRVSRPALYLPDICSRPKVVSTLDLTPRGARIETPYSLIPGERFELSVVIHSQVIRCRGEVVHILWLNGERPAAGIRFEEMAKRDRLYLGEYISSLMELQKKRFNDKA